MRITIALTDKGTAVTYTHMEDGEQSEKSQNTLADALTILAEYLRQNKVDLPKFKDTPQDIL